MSAALLLVLIFATGTFHGIPETCYNSLNKASTRIPAVHFAPPCVRSQISRYEAKHISDLLASLVIQMMSARHDSSYRSSNIPALPKSGTFEFVRVGPLFLSLYTHTHTLPNGSVCVPIEAQVIHPARPYL